MQLARREAAAAHERAQAQTTRPARRTAIAATLSTQAVTIDAAIQTATAKLAQRMPASGNVTGMFDEIA
ncbi:hypothetical protein [Paraburkholderia sp. J41]|uniref:hypothetical protein n=1 Tax=Paraburkholderia sp. J41 TaxID=2805433 RepID=UPI002AC32144|nr:hypothetical protein [Paraburkholderia sp. J41]